MRYFFSLLLIGLFTLSFLMNDVQAKRFGGGRSFGVQRSASYFSKSDRPASFQSQRQPSSASRWLGPLAGLAAGGLLAYLFMGHGLGTSILSWLMLAGVILLFINLLRNKFQLAEPKQFSDNLRTQEYVSPSYSPQSSSYSNELPAGFNAENFLREVKVQFIRLQAAYDNKNLNDIRLFTTPEIFAEIQLQLQERGDAINVTEVVSVDAQLLKAEKEFASMTASVCFSGLIREDDHTANSFKEIWHFKKENAEANWQIAGIQQETVQ